MVKVPKTLANESLTDFTHTDYLDRCIRDLVYDCPLKGIQFVLWNHTCEASSIPAGIEVVSEGEIRKLSTSEAESIKKTIGSEVNGTEISCIIQLA